LRIRVCVCLLIACLQLAACSPQQATSEQPAAFQPFLGRSLAYLARQVDDTGLLRAAPEGAVRHWLAPDNELALWVFEAARAGEAATKLRGGLTALPPPEHGLIEVMQGETIAWPPHALRQEEISPGVWVESYSGEEAIADWESDCFLAFTAALNAWNGSQAADAQRLYGQGMATFDSSGCVRVETAGRYATRDLAMAIFTGARIGAAVDKALIDALLGLQAPSGGFYAEYTADSPTGTTSTSATAYAALALMAVRQE
jgi:hypothetical protein